MAAADFEKDKTASKPIGFYDWTPELTTGMAVLPLPATRVQGRRAGRSPRYRGRAQGPARARGGSTLRSTASTAGSPTRWPASRLTRWWTRSSSLRELARQHGARRDTVAVFPPSISRETELFERMFAFGLPTNLGGHDPREHDGGPHPADPAGRVDLKPRPNDGWDQYQVYALETLLLPTAGPEKDKLLLTAEYKKRLMEAFQAIVTKQRENAGASTRCGETRRGTARRAGRRSPAAGRALPDVLSPHRPILRLHPELPARRRRPEPLGKLHGLRSKRAAGRVAGRRIGRLCPAVLRLLPALLRRHRHDDRSSSTASRSTRPAARQAALEWLDKPEADRDLACDTRVAVPIYIDPARQTTRLWADFGVRLAATWKRPTPRRPRCVRGPGAVSWKEVSPYEIVPCPPGDCRGRVCRVRAAGAERSLAPGAAPGLRSLSEQGRGYPPTIHAADRKSRVGRA